MPPRDKSLNPKGFITSMWCDSFTTVRPLLEAFVLCSQNDMDDAGLGQYYIAFWTNNVPSNHPKFFS